MRLPRKTFCDATISHHQTFMVLSNRPFGCFTIKNANNTWKRRCDDDHHHDDGVRPWTNCTWSNFWFLSLYAREIFFFFSLSSYRQLREESKKHDALSGFFQFFSHRSESQNHFSLNLYTQNITFVTWFLMTWKEVKKKRGKRRENAT